jgi:50S ribosomal protein L16 3-hydroxylase
METFSTAGDAWGRFIESDWMRRPSLIQGVVGEHFVTEADIFLAALEAARENRGSRGDKGMRIFIGNAIVASNVRDLVPVSDDGSFDGYAERLRREHGIHEFGLQLDYVHLRNPAVMRKIIPTLQGIWGQVGIPMAGAYVDAFIGNYPRTPFGVHRDRMHDFMFMIKGERRMRLWSPEAGALCALEERELEYDHHIDKALEIEGRRDSIIYWPPSYWHVGESAGLSVAMNVNFLSGGKTAFDWTCIEPLLSMIRQQRQCRLLRPSLPFVHLDSTQGSGELPLPETLGDAIDAIREACTSGAFARSVVAEWLAQFSRHGFLAEHGRRTSGGRRRLAETDVVSAVQGFPVYWARHEGFVVWGCQGRSGELPATDATEGLLQRLLSGAPAQVGALLAESSAVPGGDEFRALLEELVSIGALESAGGSSSVQPVNGAARMAG